MKLGQVTSKSDLPSAVSNSAIALPSHSHVEGDSSLVAFHCPQDGLAVAVGDEVLQSE